MTATIYIFPTRNNFRPRRDRDLDRAKRAGDAARRAGDNAADQWLAQIRAGFNNAAVINNLKIRVGDFLRLGTCDPAVRARYGGRAEMLRGLPLGIAIMRVERWWGEERKRAEPSALQLHVIAELRLILRMIRRGPFREDYEGIVALVLDNRDYFETADGLLPWSMP